MSRILVSDRGKPAIFGPNEKNGLGWRRGFSALSMTITPASAWATGSANTVTVSLSDAAGGVSVSLVSNNANGVVSSSPIVTDGSGDASFTVTPDSDGGSFTLTASASGYGDATLEVEVAGGVTAYVADGFESGDFSSPSGPGNLSWVAGAGDRNAVVSTSEARTGTYSMQFPFQAGDTSIEQRFYFNNISQVAWVEFYFHIPSNFAHIPTGQQKLAALWSGAYSETGRPKVVFEFWRIDDDESYLRVVQNMSGLTSLQVDDDSSASIGIGPSGSGNPLIIGQWNRIRFKADCGTSGNDDAAIKMWANDTVVWDYTNIGNTANSQGVGGPGLSHFFWNAGYLMGTKNGGWASAMTFYVDDFKIYDSDPGW